MTEISEDVTGPMSRADIRARLRRLSEVRRQQRRNA